ncbi:MAG: ATP-binding protein [Clostridia bacterium]|nr:ATP-binding protein [Clostridia bacterium]
MEELTVDAKPEELDAVLAFVDRQLEAIECPLAAQMQIDMAVDEIFINIASYAYTPGTGTATIRLRTLTEPRAVEITFVDAGVPYNPLDQPDPDVTLPIDERPVGGLGIFMVKKSMDDIAYEYRDGLNILTLKKFLLPPLP